MDFQVFLVIIDLISSEISDFSGKMPNSLTILGFFAFLALVLAATLVLLRIRQEPGQFTPIPATNAVIQTYVTPFSTHLDPQNDYYLSLGPPGSIRQRGHPTTAPPDSYIESGASASLYTPDPVCYDSPNNTLLCLGRVFNVTETTLAGTEIRVQLQQAGHTLREQIVSPEQPVIVPGSFAPYRAMFHEQTSDFDAVQAVPLTTQSVDDFGADVGIRDMSAVHWMNELGTGGRYVLQATLVNNEERPASNVRVTITLFNQDEEIVGYRVLALTVPIAANGIYPFQMDIIPLTTDTDLHHTIVVTAQ